MPITPVVSAPAPGGADLTTSSGTGGRGGDLFSGLLEVVTAPGRDGRGSRQADEVRANHGPRSTRAEADAEVGATAEPPAEPGTPSAADSAGSVKNRDAEQDAATDAQVGPAAADCDPVSTAQILAAAQVVPVAPVLAAAPTLAQLDQPATAGVAAEAAPGAQPVLTPAVVNSQAAQHAAAQAVASQGVPFSGLADQAVTDASGAAAGSPGGAVDAELLATLTPVATEETLSPTPTSDAPATDQATDLAADLSALTGAEPGRSGQQTAGEHAPRQESRTETLTVEKAAPAGAVSVAGVAATAPAAPVATPAPSAAAAVTGQVFPEVARLVSRGDGTHRITLKINPEALGEVRVVLTVRNGDVTVRLAGSEIAQRALQAGAPELHRLLEQVGAGATQVQVGDSSSTLGQSRDGSRHDHPFGSLGSQEGMSQGSDRDHTASNRTAGTRDGDTSARDGSTRGTHSRHSTDPGTRTRLAGVDVTM